MRTVLSHSSPDYRCDEPGCSYTGINIIEKREFTPDRPEEESEKREDISSDSGERNEIETENNTGRIAEKTETLENEDKDTDEVGVEGCLTRIFRRLCCRGPES